MQDGHLSYGVFRDIVSWSFGGNGGDWGWSESVFDDWSPSKSGHRNILLCHLLRNSAARIFSLSQSIQTFSVSYWICRGCRIKNTREKLKFLKNCLSGYEFTSMSNESCYKSFLHWVNIVLEFTIRKLMCKTYSISLSIEFAFL